jgi:hypothetical protein
LKTGSDGRSRLSIDDLVVAFVTEPLEKVFAVPKAGNGPGVANKS